MNISVIIPVYNVEHYVERCIVSIINQTYTEDVECIIINDCTQDRSMEIVEKLVEQYSGPIQFRLLHHEYNRGIAAVRNTGLNAANGHYIIYIDSDDYCEPDMLEKMYAKAIEEDADIVVTDFWMEFHDKQVYQKDNKVSSEIISRLQELLLNKVSSMLWNKLVRRKIYVDNFIQSVEGINNGEDYLLMHYLYYYADRIVYLPFAFVHYVKYNVSACTYSLSLTSLYNIIEGENRLVEFYIEKRIDKCLINELIARRIRNRMVLLAHSEGRLQEEWNNCYSDIPRGMAVKSLFSISNITIFHKIIFSFAFLDMLPVYNLMRAIWRFI